MKEIRAATIQHHNKILLDKMLAIERKPTDLNPSNISRKYYTPHKTLNTPKRINDLKKINVENKVATHDNSNLKAFLKRLQSAHSTYSIDKWLDEDRKNSEYRLNISRNGRRSMHADYGTLSQYPKLTRSSYSNYNEI